MKKATPNTVPLNGRWLFLFKIHVAVVGPILTGLFLIAGWTFVKISAIDLRVLHNDEQIESLHRSFEDVRENGSPITRERLSVLENLAGVGRPPPQNNQRGK